jgi:HD-GYP domain-containing protein (c-di-GMP phosphodiesterase class II)
MMHQHEPKHSGRSALVRAIDEQRTMLAARIGAQCGTSAMLARSLLTALGSALVSMEAQPLIGWARMAAGMYPARVVRSTIEVAFKNALAISEGLPGEGLDLGSLLVFLEIVSREIDLALQFGADLLPDAVTEGNSESIDGILAMLKARDEATCTHSRITGVWCRRIADALKLDPVSADRTVVGGVLHDIGKVATPDAVLLKAGPLDEREWEIMRAHSLAGADLLLEIPSLARYVPVVRAHHERIDGRGYPYGLVGDEIPFEARIVAVADAFHAMTSDRPYRQAYTFGEAIEILRAGRGRQWDAPVVDVMIGVAVELRNKASDADLDTNLGIPLLDIDRSMAM